MKPSDHLLQRLFRAASRAPRETDESMPRFLENRLLTHWRSAGGLEEFPSLGALFRWAILYAAIIMILSIGCSWVESRRESISKTGLVNYALTIQLPP